MPRWHGKKAIDKIPVVDLFYSGTLKFWSEITEIMQCPASHFFNSSVFIGRRQDPMTGKVKTKKE